MTAAEPILYGAKLEAHFVKRARQHFGLRVSHTRYLAWCQAIKDVAPHTQPLGPDRANPGYRSAWAAKFGGHLMRVIFDDDLEQLVTCIPYDRKHPDRQRPGYGGADYRGLKRRLKRR